MMDMIERGTREEVVALLQASELANLATISPSGWPIAHCMHFVPLVDESQMPLVYMYTHYGTRKLLNIAKDSRVSVSFTGTPAHAASPSLWLRLQGRAALVMDLVEREALKTASHNREGYEFTKSLDLDRQPLLRITPDLAVYTAPGGDTRSVAYAKSLASSSV